MQVFLEGKHVNVCEVMSKTPHRRIGGKKPLKRQLHGVLMHFTVYCKYDAFILVEFLSLVVFFIG